MSGSRTMSFRFPFLPLLLFFLALQCPSVTSRLSRADVTLKLTSDQPVIMGTNITFVLKLSNPVEEAYDVKWNEFYGPSRVLELQDALNGKNNYTTSWTLSYLEEKPKVIDKQNPYLYPGTYPMSASVSHRGFFWVYNVGTVVHEYNVVYNFTGKVVPTQPGVPKRNATFMTTANETVLTADVHDPTGYLGKGQNVTFSWYNETGFMENTTVPTLKRNFTKEGEFHYNVTVTAIYPNSSNPNVTVLRQGLLQGTVLTRVPVSNFTVIGETWFPHGRLLDLTVMCGGSQPFQYCMQLHPGLYNLTGNETCISPTGTDTCKIPYVWYFQEPGYHTFVVIMENDVSRVVNRTLIRVYKVSKQQPLSIIIVPLGCSIIAIVMIIFGVAFFWESRARYSVEVADFDFGHNEEVPYMTFVERLKDAFTASTSSRQRLYNSTDDDPILGSRRGSQWPSDG